MPHLGLSRQKPTRELRYSIPRNFKLVYGRCRVLSSVSGGPYSIQTVLLVALNFVPHMSRVQQHRGYDPGSWGHKQLIWAKPSNSMHLTLEKLWIVGSKLRTVEMECPEDKHSQHWSSQM